MNLRDTRLVQLADEAKRPSPWWMAWVVAAVVIVGGGTVGVAIGDVVLGAPSPTDIRYQYVEAFVFGLTLAALCLWVRFKERRPMASVGFPSGVGAVKKFLVGWLVGIAWMTVGVLLTTLIGQFSTHGSTHTTNGIAALPPLIPLIFVFFLQGSTEEAVTRGYMLQMGGRQLPGWVAILGSAIVFAVVHVTFEPVVLLNLVLYAVFASFVALEQGSLWLIAGFHAGWNLAQTNVFGLPDSGNPAATALFSFGPADGSSPLINGGDFGIEGGLMGTLLFGSAAVVAFLRFRRNREVVGSSITS